MTRAERARGGLGRRAALLLGVYAAVAAAMWWWQDRLVYPGAVAGRGLDLPHVQAVRVELLAVPGSGRVRLAVGTPAAPVRGVLLFFLGNGDDLREGVYWAGELTGYGIVALIPEYPGYGDSDGRPSMASVFATADAAADHGAELAARWGVPLLVGGTSLGSFPATHLAAAGRGERLLLLAPPTSLADVAARRYWWLPVRWLLRDHYDNLEAARAVRCPSLVVHGDQDRLVPAEMGRAVAAALGGELLPALGHGHTRLPISPHGPWSARIGEFLLGDANAAGRR